MFCLRFKLKIQMYKLFKAYKEKSYKCFMHDHLTLMLQISSGAVNRVQTVPYRNQFTAMHFLTPC